jgi:hypothetical protein
VEYEWWKRTVKCEHRYLVYRSNPRNRLSFPLWVDLLSSLLFELLSVLAVLAVEAQAQITMRLESTSITRKYKHNLITTLAQRPQSIFNSIELLTTRIPPSLPTSKFKAKHASLYYHDSSSTSPMSLRVGYTSCFTKWHSGRAIRRKRPA